MAHELLTGHVPFESVFDTGSAELMRDVVTNEPYDAPEDLPGYARRALAKALSKDPKDRFRSCAAFADALAGKGTPPEASDSPGIGAAPQPPVSKEDASRSRVEAKMHKLRFERLTEEPGFAGRRPLLEEAFLKGEMFFEAGLWGDAFRQFAGYVKEVEAFEKQAAERKAAAQMAAEEAERIRIGPETGTSRSVALPGGVKMEFVWCRPGTFIMGSPRGEEGRERNERQHQVTLTRGFWIGKYPVTQEQWESVMGSNPSHFKGSDRPVENVSWDDCQVFIGRVNARLSGEERMRLPTEAEWEYACRAGTTGAYGGTGDLGEMGWYEGNSWISNWVTRSKWFGLSDERVDEGGLSTHPVGQKKPNAWGLYDMHGNVWEWCNDWDGDYPKEAVRDPVGPPSGVCRVPRGGSWNDSARYCRSASRGRCGPGGRYDPLGFRASLAPRS